MGKVIVKHSDKQKKINKANKEAAKDREYAIAENLDKEIAFKQKLKGIWQIEEEKRRQLKNKSKAMENKNNAAKEDMEKAIKARKFETEGKLKEQ